MLRRRIDDFVAVVAKNEFQAFARVGLLFAITERTVERIVSRFALRLRSRRFRLGRRNAFLRDGRGLLDVFTPIRGRQLYRPGTNLGRRPRIDSLNGALDWRLERTRRRPRTAHGTRRLRYAFDRLRSRFAYPRRHRVGAEHMAASRALEGRCIVWQHPLVNAIAGVAASALNFYHLPTSRPLSTTIIRHKVAHLPDIRLWPFSTHGQWGFVLCA
jgi:hypothetical protein